MFLKEAQTIISLQVLRVEKEVKYHHIFIIPSTGINNIVNKQSDLCLGQLLLDHLVLHFYLTALEVHAFCYFARTACYSVKTFESMLGNLPNHSNNTRSDFLLYVSTFL